MRLSRALGGALVAAAALVSGSSDAAPAHVLRFATIAPDGTEWARLSRSFSREVEQATEGNVVVKWYFGGIAGDEQGMIDRVRRGQLDGVASGGMMCQRLAPSMRVMRIVGLFQSRDEALYVLGRLKPRLDREFAASGFANLGEAGFGSDVLFSREPVRTFADLKRLKLWVWDLDDVFRTEAPAIGLNLVPMPVEAALGSYERGEVDGMIGIPSAALAYQWSSRARYVSDLRMGYLMGCLVVSNTAFDPLPVRDRQVVLQAAAKLMRQMEDMGDHQDAALLHTLFVRQGMKHVDTPQTLRSQFLEASRRARETLAPKLAEPALLNEVTSWLADYRSERAQ
jgi:TRAP-type C4-dicarboxylate transport system substrate-binding protein